MCAFWVRRDPLLCQTNRCLDLYLASFSRALYLHIMVLMAWPAHIPQGKWEYSSGCLQNGISYDGTTLLRPSPSFCFQSLSSHLQVSFQSLLQKCFLTPGKLKWGSCPCKTPRNFNKRKEVPALLSTVSSFQNSLGFFPAGYLLSISSVIMNNKIHKAQTLMLASLCGLLR